MNDKRKAPDDGRRQNDRRNTKAGAAAASERRGQTIVRERDILDIPIPPLKGSIDRRAGSRRDVESGEGSG